MAGGNFVDPQALMAIRNLELRAQVVVEGFWNGLHRSPYHGFSVEFTEYRQYSPGDDLRYLDWRVYARSDRFYVKKFEDETNLRCYLLVDNSRSMSYSSLPYTKANYSATLAATLAQFLYSQGDAVGLMTFDEQVREYLPARHRTGHLRHLMLALDHPVEGARTDLAAPLQRIVEIIRKRALLILISDLLAPVTTLERDLGSLVASGHEVVVFQVLDPTERTFRFDKPVLFRDVETEADLFIDPDAARTDYVRRLEAHQDAIQQTCRQMGVAFHPLSSDRPLELALYDFLRDRMQRGKKTKRTGMRRSESAA